MESLINNLEQLAKCPACDKKCRTAKALILKQEETRTTLHLTCDRCKTSTLVFVSMGKFGIVSFKMLTDLDSHEAKRLFKSETVSTDQVIGIHQFLKNCCDLFWRAFHLEAC